MMYDQQLANALAENSELCAEVAALRAQRDALVKAIGAYFNARPDEMIETIRDLKRAYDSAIDAAKDGTDDTH